MLPPLYHAKREKFFGIDKRAAARYNILDRFATQPPHVENHVEKGGTTTNQQRLAPDLPLKRATFWMQEPVIGWLRAYAKASGITQGALLNAIILDYQLRNIDKTLLDPTKAAKIRRYVDALLGACPPIKPAPSYRVTQGRPVSQAYKSPK
jgi:hypothetical protein